MTGIDDTIGEYSIRIGDERYDLEKVAKRAAILAVSLEIHESSIIHDPDVTICVSKLPKTIKVYIEWNEEGKSSEFYLQHEHDRIKLYGRIRNKIEKLLME